MTKHKDSILSLASALAPLLANADSDFCLDEGDTGTATIKLNNITQAQWQALQQQLEHLRHQPKQGESHTGDNTAQAPDPYAKYYQEIRDCPMYKPKNPNLAISHVAKLHGLEVDDLKKAFKSYT